MKKFFTLAAAVLASFSLWAAEPNYGSYDWGADDFATVFTNHDGIVLSSDASAWKGNFSGIQYVALGGGTDMSAASPTPYFGITADAPIDSIEVFWAPNGTNNTSVAWAGWEEASDLLNQTVVAMGKTETYKATKSYDAAIWQKIDLSGYDFKAVMLARQIKKAIIDGQQQSNHGDNQTVNILGIRVWVRATKTIVSTVETLTDAKINGVALDPNSFNELINSQSVEVLNAYTTAPTVTFTKHVVITYDDESTKQSDVDVEVVAEALGSNQWTANITLNGADAYSITMQRAAAYTVTYKLEDETVLGTELVAAGEHPAEYAQYEVMPLSSFNGWYESDPLETVDLSQVVVNADMSFYADFDKAYAQSIDFEGMVINNGKSYDVKSALTANFYDYKTIDALDSLNNAKGAARNEPYLGLKIKKNGGYLACNVQPGTTLRIKFGYVAETVLAIAGGDTLRLVPTDNKLADLTVPFMVEKLVKLQTTSDKTVVIKQIMIDDPIATWMYPITYAEAEHGTVSGWTIAFPDEEVQLSFTMDEGYTLVSCYANEQAVVSTPNVGEFFTMPAEAVTVNATFGDTATAIDNAEEEVKAVKVIRNGQLFIEKNGVLYDAQGAIVR
jgi:hypothetical protein